MVPALLDGNLAAPCWFDKKKFDREDAKVYTQIAPTGLIPAPSEAYDPTERAARKNARSIRACLRGCFEKALFEECKEGIVVLCLPTGKRKEAVVEEWRLYALHPVRKLSRVWRVVWGALEALDANKIATDAFVETTRLWLEGNGYDEVSLLHALVADRESCFCMSASQLIKCTFCDGSGPAKYYVYLYLDCKFGTEKSLTEEDLIRAVFYIGKGEGGRRHDHLQDALDATKEEEEEAKNQKTKHGKIRELWAAGRGPRVVTVFSGLTSDVALSVEDLLVREFKERKAPLTNKATTSSPAKLRDELPCRWVTRGKQQILKRHTLGTIRATLVQHIVRHFSTLSDITAPEHHKVAFEGCG